MRAEKREKDVIELTPRERQQLETVEVRPAREVCHNGRSEPTPPDQQQIEAYYRDILTFVGEDPDREGLLRTPHRVAEALKFLTRGYTQDIQTLLNGAVFQEDYDDMVIVKDIEFYSMCVPSKQIVNAVGGAKAARSIQQGDQLWTLHEGRVVPTTVTDIAGHKTREVVTVETERGILRVTPDHPFATPDGWVEARDLEGRSVEWTLPKGLCRNRWQPRNNYDFGYAVGAVTSDGTVGSRCVSLVVNEREFACRFAQSLEAGFGLSNVSIEPVVRPSGYTGRATPGYRVRVVSSYLADLMRQYAGGDAHHMRQRFPRVVLNDRDVFAGFLDGYVEGDGFRNKYSDGRTIVSGNIPFLQDLAGIVGARFTPRPDQHSSKLYVADSWERKHGFRQEDHRTDLVESRWVKVQSVTPCKAVSKKPYTVYSFTCEPYPTFLINGHLSHNCEHHMLPFFGKAHVAYIPNGRIVGLSKIPRLVDMFARRLQVQERLTTEIAEALQEALKPHGVAVVLEGAHMCMMMRGVQKQESMTMTSHVMGAFRTDRATRQEFMALIKGNGRH